MSDVIESIERNNLKLSADKILQGLKKVRNEPSKSRRRWIWELVQNAKDVPNKFGRVRIKVELSKDELRFSHNGDPFTIGNITGLIQQVSTKPSAGDDPDQTGKWGTGFISTHLLSEQTTVQGVTVRPGGKAKRFTIELDRSGRTSEELIPHIEAAIERIKGIDENPEFEEIPDYAKQRSANDLDTALAYRFHGKQGLPAAQVGLDDLRNTLPFTLANVPKIEAVSVVDGTRSIDVNFQCEAKEFGKHVRAVQVTIQDGDKEEKVHFICWDAEGITLMVELADPERKSLKPNFGEHPTLYRQFPLIGSEKFHWPFMVNGDTFFPTEDREGLFLNSDEDEDSLANRALLERAVDEAVAFAKWLIEHGFTDRYVMAYTRIPDIAWEGEAKEWYKRVQASWREQILELTLVENHVAEPTVLKDVFIPKFGTTKELREEFWELYAPFVGYGLVPRKDLLHAWLEAIGPEDEMGTWGREVQLCFDLDDLFRQIAEDKSLDKIELDTLPNGDKPATLEWLRSVIQFAIEQEETDLLSEHAVVPNHLGELFELSDLYEEDASMPIPDEVLDILSKLGVDWRAELIHRDIKPEGIQHQRRGLRDASEKVAEQLGPKRKQGEVEAGVPFLQRQDALDVLFGILAMVPPGGRDSFQSKLFKSAAFLFKHEGEMRKVEGVSEFNFAPALRLMVQAVHEAITAHGTISALAEALEVTVDRAVLWLDEHLRLVASNSEYEHFLKVGNIIPNRKGAFGAYEDLFNYGTEEHPLDAALVAILVRLDTEQDWDEELIGDGIGIRLPNTRTMAELGEAIQKHVKLTRNDPGLVADQREPLLNLIDWCWEHELAASTHLAGFIPSMDGLFAELVTHNFSPGAIRLLGQDSVARILKQLDAGKLNSEDVDQLLTLGSELGSLKDLIASAEDLVEEQRDFEYKKALGQSIERALIRALQASNIDAEVIYRGGGSHDVEVRSKFNRRVYHIELKSVSVANKGPLKLAASQARAFIEHPEARALCLLERSVRAEEVTVEHIRQQLLFRKDIGDILLKGLQQYDQLEAIMSADDVDLRLLGEVRIKLRRERFMEAAQDFDALIRDIRSVLVQ